jgi:hypothetical protein
MYLQRLHSLMPNNQFLRISIQVGEWESFDVFAVAAENNGRPLAPVTTRLLLVLGLLERMKLQVERLHSFLSAAEAEYLGQPYHNSIHAADVVQALGAMILADDWCKTLEDWEVLALLIAGATHDLGHPGVNNAFHQRLKAASDEENSLAPDEESINERHHASLALALLESSQNDFLEGLGHDTKSDFKQLLQNLILATDMAHHSAVIGQFSTAMATWGPDLRGWPLERRHGALKMLLHCADISNPARPLKQCVEWGRRVQEELYGQGDRERHVGLEVTPACDRGMSEPEVAQAKFIERVVQPCIQVLEPLAPNFVAIVQPHIEKSLQYWEQMARRDRNGNLTWRWRQQVLT